jgi:uncharacterized RDD family membrane protein YckC
MSEGTPKDPAQPRMPWEPEPPAGGTSEPPTPPDPGWKPPEPTDPTTVWTPTPPTDRPASPPPWQPPAPLPPGQAGLITSAPVGWGAPPPAAAEVAPGLVFANTTARVIAYVIDLVILYFLVYIVAAILGLAAATTITDTSVMTRFGGSVGSIILVLFGLAYFAGSWTGGRRATIGQRAMSIQVGNAFDGRPLSLEQAIRRWLGLGDWLVLLGIVPSLIAATGVIQLLWTIILLITTATSPTKQGLHDRFANTALVRPSGQGTSGFAKACLIIIILLLILPVVGIIGLILLGGQASEILSRIGESI